MQCDRIVERAPDGSCAQAGQPAEVVYGQIPLGASEALPCLPRFNVAAFLVPFIWGPAHGQWAGLFFLPIWLFVDNTIRSAREVGGVLVWASALVVAATLAFQFYFALRANGLAYRRVCDQLSVEAFVRRERFWAVGGIVAFLLAAAWVVAYESLLR
jgi:hypothetical protein